MLAAGPRARPRAVIVLAAGRGTRFPGVESKVLVELNGRPLVAWVLDSVFELQPDRVVVVVGHGREAVERQLSAWAVETAVQESPLGTGHAVLAAADALGEQPFDVLVLNGDVPLVRPRTLAELFDRVEGGADAALLTAVLDDPGAYGRVERTADGSVMRIIEAADATADELLIHEINVGSYAFRAPQLFEILRTVGQSNAQGEIYLTDVVGRLVDGNHRVDGVILEDPLEGAGVNSPADLDRLEGALARRP